MSEYKTRSAIAAELGTNWQRIRTICRNMTPKKIKVRDAICDGYPIDEVKAIYLEQESLPRQAPLGAITMVMLRDKYKYDPKIVGLIMKDKNIPAPVGYMVVPTNLRKLPYYEETSFLKWVKEHYPTKNATLDHLKQAKKKAKEKPVVKEPVETKEKYKNPLAFFDIARGL